VHPRRRHPERGLSDEAAMTGIYTKARRDPSAAALIERIRKVN
jgi:hypothetical protein